MAAGGFKEFVAGETLDENEINDYLMQGVLVFAGTAARGSAIGTPVEGQFSFRTDDDVLEFYDGSDWVQVAASPITFDFLVIGGGASGGVRAGGGGGAGGYRTSVGTSGGGASAESSLSLLPGNYIVRIGAGGPGGATIEQAGRVGTDSTFGPIISFGGGEGRPTNVSGGNGGSGGAGSTGGTGAVNQGFDGGGAISSTGGGGGGASQAGVTPTVSGNGGAGGNGVASTITGSSVTRAGGGGGGSTSTGGAGGTGGGGAGSAGLATAGSGTVNTGSGGGGSGFSGGTNGANGAGGSGVVIIKYPDTVTLTIGAGLTSSTATSGGFKVTTFTAGFDTVTIP